MTHGSADARQAALPFDDLASIGIPVPLDNSRYSSANLAKDPSSKAKNPPNALLAVGQIRWLQDTAYDSFSNGESIWQTVLQVVRGEQEIFKAPSSPDGIPTVRVVPFRGHWHAVDTRRILVYKILFHPDQLIPIRKIEFTQEAEGKAFRHERKDDGNTIELKLRVHTRVPHGICNLKFIRNAVILGNSNPAICGLETAMPNESVLSDGSSSSSCLQMEQRPEGEHEHHTADQQSQLKPPEEQFHDRRPQSRKIPPRPKDLFEPCAASWKKACAEAAAARDTAIIERLARIGQRLAVAAQFRPGIKKDAKMCPEAKCIARAWDAVDEILTFMPASTSMKKLAIEVRNVLVCILDGAEEHTRDSFLAAACAAFGRCPLGPLVESRLFLAYATLFKGSPGAFELKNKGRHRRPARRV